MTEVPMPRFSVGQKVTVVLNETNKTPHTGSVREVIWHHKNGRYNYYLEENGKKISKQYFEEDLEPVE